MSDTPRLHEIAKRTVQCDIEGIDAVSVQRDVPYAIVDGHVLTMDIYRPGHSDRETPMVLLVTGYPDEGARRILGCNAKDMASYMCWGRLIAASGMAAVTYTNRTPEAAVGQVIEFVTTRAETFGIDPSRIGLWSCSGNVPNALAALIELAPPVTCAVLLYGYMFDGPGSTVVAESARQFGFVNAVKDRSVDDLPPDVPLLVVRAGLDEMPGLNGTIDSFVQQAAGRNLPVTFVNHFSGAHAFDIGERTLLTNRIVRQVLSFLQLHLNG